MNKNLNWMENRNIKIYQAPLQGFTDLCQRKAFSKVYGGVDKYFIPYISYGKNREIKKSQLIDILAENNPDMKVIPQVLFANSEELVELVKIVSDLGHNEINLNFGCPYPMVTNKGRGAAWLSKPGELEKSLEILFIKSRNLKFSVKLRSGLNNELESEKVFEILNKFQFEEVIFHPRTASQMYSGKADRELFKKVLAISKNTMVYNGDILSENDLSELQTLLETTENWMIGRGLLIDPALALKLKGETFEHKKLRSMMTDYHENIFSGYSERLAGSGHLLMKMKNFWTYFSESFNNPRKAMKMIKKAGSIQNYNAAVTEVFRNF